MPLESRQPFTELLYYIFCAIGMNLEFVGRHCKAYNVLTFKIIYYTLIRAQLKSEKYYIRKIQYIFYNCCRRISH